MTTTQIQTKAKNQIKKEFVKKNEVISWNIQGDDSFGLITVTIPSSCEANETMKWEFTYSYEPSNKDVFTELEAYEFPHLITKEKLTVIAV